jgi:hypothetical protein
MSLSWPWNYRPLCNLHRSSPYSQKGACGPHLKPAQSNPYNITLKKHFNIILLSMSNSLNGVSFLEDFWPTFCMNYSQPPMHAVSPTHLIISWLNLNNIWQRVQFINFLCPATCHADTKGQRIYKLLLILDLCTRWRWVVSIMPWPHFTPGRKDPPVPTGQEAGWASRAGQDTEATEKILSLCWGSNHGSPVWNLTLYWLSYPRQAKDFSSSLCVQTRSKALESFPWVKHD